MNRPFNRIAASFLLAFIFAATSGQLDAPALALDNTPASAHGQSLQDLFESEFAILRIQGNQVKVAGVGFVIHQDPLRLLTCNHVVSEGTELNDGPVFYAIARRPESTNEIDVRRVTWSWLKIKTILTKPEYDLAILEVDPHGNEAIAAKLNLGDSKPLTLNFDRSQRSIGSPVTWLTTAAQGDLTLTPRLFTGSVVANYIADEKYSFQTSAGSLVQQTISGARMLEIDKLFLPGASGSPILNAETMQVIGYVHGYRPFALNTNLEATEAVEVGDGAEFKPEKLKYKLPLVTSVSLGIDLRTAEEFLTAQGYVGK